MQSTGVTVVVVLAAALVAVASSVYCAAVDDIPTDYLDLPRGNVRSRDDLYDEVLRKDTRPAGLEPGKMLEEFAELMKSAPGARERHFYKTMHTLGEEGDEACNLAVHDYVYELISLAKQHPESPVLANYMNLLKTIGKAKFGECAARTARDFEIRTGYYQGNMVNFYQFRSVESGLNKFYATYAGAKKALDSAQLYEIAKKADFANGDFNVRQMLKIAKAYTDRQYTQEPLPIDLLRDFQDYACANIKLGLDEALGQYNIAAALGAPLPNDVPARFLKLNEYRRICLHYNEDKKIDENISRLLEADSSKWYKFGKN